MQTLQTPITPIVLSISLGLAGCASGGKNAMLPQDGPTMKEVYDAHFGRSRLPEETARDAMGSRKIDDGPADLYGYTRDMSNEIDALFPRLPNPTLVLYVFPHLTGPAGNPVPGYATSFSMYETVEYALPGEVPGVRGPAARSIHGDR